MANAVVAFLDAAQDKIKKLDNYRLALLFVLPISIALLIYLFCVHGILLPEWFLDLLQIPAVLGALFSGSTYIARILDALSTRKSSDRSSRKLATIFNFQVPAQREISLGEKIGTIIGLLAGVATSIALICLGEIIPLAKPLHALGDILFTLGSISAFAGLGNRLGSCIGTDRPKNEKIALSIATIIGIALGIALFATGAAALVSVMGVTSFFSGGLAIPVWIAGIIFVASFTSSIVSCTDYTAKAYNYLRFASNNAEKPLADNLRTKRHEYRGAMVGVGIGLTIGLIILTALLITQPHIFIGLAGIVVAAVIITSSMGLMGGISSRIGRFIDGFTGQQPATQAAKSNSADLSNSQTEQHKIKDNAKNNCRRLSLPRTHAMDNEEAGTSENDREILLPPAFASSRTRGTDIINDNYNAGNLLATIGFYQEQLRPTSPEPAFRMTCNQDEHTENSYIGKTQLSVTPQELRH